MNRPFRLTRVPAAIALISLLAVSCAKKPVSLTDPSLTPPVYPEGRPGNTHLVMYPDTPVPVQTYEQAGANPNPSGDVLLSTEYFYESGPGAVVGMIIDSTNATQYQVYKRHADGGFLNLLSYTLKPVKSWPASHFDRDLFTDPSPFSPPDRQYIGRGVVDGQVTTDSPLTNLSDMSQLNVPGTLQYLGNVFPDTTTDSLVFLRWRAVPGAAGYWISMYALPTSVLSQSGLLRSALPRPVVPDRLPDYFIAYIPAPTTSYKLGNPLPPGGRLISYGRTIVTQNPYAVRIVAVDANGQMLDYTGSSGAYVTVGVPNSNPARYLFFPIAAAVVFPASPPPGLSALTARMAEATAALARPLAPGEARISSIRGPRH
jgi:hypothetical protein